MCKNNGNSTECRAVEHKTRRFRDLETKLFFYANKSMKLRRLKPDSQDVPGPVKALKIVDAHGLSMVTYRLIDS